jgi:hypothetical protein
MAHQCSIIEAHSDEDHLRDSRSYGSRYASRVRIAAAQGSAYNGRTGVVVRTHEATGNVIVRLDGKEIQLPFGRSDLEVLR